MLTTAELRWFERGKLPEEILHWFGADCLGEQLQPPAVREDVYLCLDEGEYLGIKLRQGRLEIKWRNAELGIVQFGDRVAGNAETWSKWFCEDPTGESFQPATVLGKSWVSVKKERSQRLFQVLPDKSIVAVATNTESIKQGCSVEITQLSINDNAWWSLAFEAFGENNCLMSNLQAVANWVFSTYSGSKLLAQNSYAYPHWLNITI